MITESATVCRWTVDQDALDEFCAEVGLHRKAVVSKGRFLTNYGHYAEYRARRHHITVHFALGIISAGRTVTHELGHALQVERFGFRQDRFEAQFERDLFAAGLTHELVARNPDHAVTNLYRKLPLEAEAIKFEFRNWTRLLDLGVVRLRSKPQASVAWGPTAETDPHCEGCGRSLVGRFGTEQVPAECPACLADFNRLLAAGKLH